VYHKKFTDQAQYFLFKFFENDQRPEDTTLYNTRI